MRKLVHGFVFILSVCVLSFGGEESSEEGFVSLFNGENLDGWVNVQCAPETWSVRDGIIVCTGIPTGVLRTEKQYQNYILELEWRHLHPRGNAGLFVHSYPITAPGQPFTRSIEVQIMDGNHGDIFAIHGASMTPITPHPKGSQRPACRRGVIRLAVTGTITAWSVMKAHFPCSQRKSGDAGVNTNRARGISAGIGRQ